MAVMSRWLLAVAVLSLALGGSRVPTAADPAGTPAPPAVAREIERVVLHGAQRFEAKDVVGVLTHVSEQYRTGPMTKPALREHLATMFGLYERLKARVRIDEIRMVGEHAWIYSTGEVSGQVPLVGGWMTILWWERELEVARREHGAWRLYGYQQ
jgi:hypothetical protein